MEEVIETEALPELIEAVVVLIHDPADAQNFLRVANTAFPLPSALGHLKRIRRGADAGTCGAAPNNDSATIGASRTRLELLLCLSSDIADLASVAQKFSQEACATASVKLRRHTNSDDLAATLAPRLVEVPNLAPRQFPEEWTKWNAYWPLAVPKPQPPHRPTENEVQHAMDMIHQHLQPHYVRLQREAPHLLPIVAAIVDPSVDGARQVLATSSGFPGLCQSNVAGSAPYARMVDCGCTANGIVAEHPVTFVLKELANHQLYLRHGTNGEEVSTESSSMAARPYLANGLDLFVTHEPCVMCSMALVHSRIERVFFCYPNQAHGGLGSTFHVHSIPSLNHHFRAFHCFRAAELLKSAL